MCTYVDSILSDKDEVMLTILADTEKQTKYR